MSDFEDVRLIDLLTKVEVKARAILEDKSIAEFKELGGQIQAVYDFVITAKKSYEEQQPMLKNLFSSFNYAAVIINEAVKERQLDTEAKALLVQCVEIIIACCGNVKKSL